MPLMAFKLEKYLFKHLVKENSICDISLFNNVSDLQQNIQRISKSTYEKSVLFLLF